MPDHRKSVRDPRESPLFKELQELWQSLQQEVNGRWNRTLPLADYFVDRWHKAHLLGFGEGTSIYDSSLVIGDVKVGNSTWIGPFTLLDGSGGLKIGSNCSISAGVQIYTHDTAQWAVSGGKAGYEYAPVVIGDCCYIGPQTVIAKGVTIGEHTIIGACSFVNSNIPPFTIAFGVPCRPTGRVNIKIVKCRTVGSKRKPPLAISESKTDSVRKKHH